MARKGGHGGVLMAVALIALTVAAVVFTVNSIYGGIPYVTKPVTQSSLLPGVQQSSVSDTTIIKTLTFQTLVENKENRSRYGGTAATVDVMSGCTQKPSQSGVLVEVLTQADLNMAASCSLSANKEPITCSTTSPNRCTSAKTYKTGETVLLHASTTERGGAYDNLYLFTFTNVNAIPSGGGDEIFDIPALGVYDRVDNDYVLFRPYSNTGTALGGTADGNSFRQNVTTAGTSANNFTLRTQSADFTIKVSINNIAGERSTCFGCRSFFLRNVGNTPQLTMLRSVIVVSFNTNVGESGLLGQGWIKLSGGFPTANKTFYKVLEPLIADQSGSTTEHNVVLPVDLTTISGQTATTINIWIADMQIVPDVAQGAGTTAGTSAAAFAFSTRGLTALQGSRYTTTAGNQVADSFTTVAQVLKGVA